MFFFLIIHEFELIQQRERQNWQIEMKMKIKVVTIKAKFIKTNINVLKKKSLLTGQMD